MNMQYSKRSRTLLLLVATSAFALHASTSAFGQSPHEHEGGREQGCGSYERDVGMDLELLGGDRADVTAGDGAGASPDIRVGEGYTVRLVPQEEMEFPTEPTRHMLAEGAFGGLMSIEVPVAGSYRISLTKASWVDLAAGDEMLESTDFSGRHGCEHLRKWVSYELEAGRLYTLMLSGGTEQVLGAAVVPADHQELE